MKTLEEISVISFQTSNLKTGGRVNALSGCIEARLKTDHRTQPTKKTLKNKEAEVAKR
ncbi:hypothetical protein LB452_02095 [Psychroflexus sp. CAK8W]|uniref:Uncharacterized protein n=1 Tax=Psychroflexus longus TaxID=2873596 RepID=A0ABS7XFG6_9FLAO|nr:hypothetical protein [Psychroflexus longus]MBZ9777702.1 hypothetical protein [Psychroflexus longus]